MRSPPLANEPARGADLPQTMMASTLRTCTAYESAAEAERSDSWKQEATLR